jgi:hypothetical protein
LARDYKNDARKTQAELKEALEEGHVKPDDFSIRALAENLIPDGREYVSLMDPNHGGGFQEAAGAVSTTSFSNITGQILYTTVMQGFQQEAFVFTNLIPTKPTSFDGEKIPGITGIGDQAQIVDEGKGYPLAGVSEDYIETPRTTKRGVIVPVTKEAIFFDRTGLLLDRANKVGEALGLNKEKRACDCVVDENTTAHRYKWRGNVIATYNDNTGTHTWDNLSASTGLVDFTDIDAMEQLLGAMLDPNTGEPIMVMADTLICNPQLVHTARAIINATMVRLQAGGFATTGDLYSRESANPIGGGPFSANYNLVTSRMLPTRMATDTSWFLGNPKKAFAYMENWPITVVQAPPNAEAEFQRDIVVQYKASERGAYATLEPRYMAKATA